MSKAKHALMVLIVMLFIVTSARAATLLAHIVLQSPAPPAKPINTAADPYCTTMHKTDKLMTEEVVVNPGGTLRDAFVFVSEGATGSYPTPKTPVILDQVGCRYVPHSRS
jgi:hypothetical protein